jgi:hypothetical protein
MHQPEQPAAPQVEPTGDYGYDLAHEVTDPPAPGPTEKPAIYVRTESSDQGEDYGYDLAHDVPGRE